MAEDQTWFSSSVQQELLPRVSMEVGYYRRWLKNFIVTDNLTLKASNFDPFTIAAPSDARLPNGGGYAIPGVEIRATQAETGVARTTVTNETGSYVLPNLPIGPYKLEASLPGFRTYAQTIVLACGCR